EWDRAVSYASRPAMRGGGGAAMLRVIETEDQHQHWLGVADIMRAAAEENANAALDRASARANRLAGITPEPAARQGHPHEQIREVIEQGLDVTMRVLVANPGAEGPGPLITTIAKAVGSFPSPVVILPGHLGDAAIEGRS